MHHELSKKQKQNKTPSMLILETNSRILQLKCWFVLLISYKIEPLELGDKMRMTVLQHSVRSSYSLSWWAFKVLTEIIGTAYLVIRTQIQKRKKNVMNFFAILDGMAFKWCRRDSWLFYLTAETDSVLFFPSFLFIGSQWTLSVDDEPAGPM